jgi:hypothetical protein
VYSVLSSGVDYYSSFVLILLDLGRFLTNIAFTFIVVLLRRSQGDFGNSERGP